MPVAHALASTAAVSDMYGPWIRHPAAGPSGAYDPIWRPDGRIGYSSTDPGPRTAAACLGWPEASHTSLVMLSGNISRGICLC